MCDSARTFRTLRAATLLLMLSSATLGCNYSRYGIRHDQRLPSIKTVEICPIAISVSSLHAGGDQEARPDITSQVIPKILEEMQKLVSEKGFQVAAREHPVATSAPAGTPNQSYALLIAVQEAIFVHHYQYGKTQMFDHSLADAADGLHGRSCDAVLCITVSAAVPTESRKALAVTGIVVGVLTGVTVVVPTHILDVQLTLVHAETGDVLWFNRFINNADVRSEHGLRRSLEQASSYLLKPLKPKG